MVSRESLVKGEAPPKESMNFFHYQVLKWHQGLDPSVRFDTVAIEADDSTFFSATQDETEVYVKTLLYLRCNQIRILVLRPMLIYPQTARNNPSLIKEVIEVARKQIRTLNKLALEGGLYKTRQAIFNHFLSSALAVLFLAAAYDAETRSVRAVSSPTLLGDCEELQQGLDLIDHCRASAQSAERLWVRFDRARQQLIRLGFLQTRAQNQVQEGSLAPLGMDGVSSGLSDFNQIVDFDPNTLEPEGNHLWLGWFNDDFMDSPVPFGLHAWM